MGAWAGAHKAGGATRPAAWHCPPDGCKRERLGGAPACCESPRLGVAWSSGPQDLGGGRRGGGWGHSGAGRPGPGEGGGWAPRTRLRQHRGQRPGPAAPRRVPPRADRDGASGCSKPALGTRRRRTRLGPRHAGPLGRPGPAAAMLLETELERNGDRPGASAAAAACAFRGTQGEALAPRPSARAGGPRGETQQGRQRRARDACEEGRSACRERGAGGP